MTQTTRNWLPVYCHPDSLLPAVQETIILFSRPPYLFQDFVAKAIAFLRSDTARKMGFDYNPATALPAIGTPETGGRGKVVGGALEYSTVDIGREFTNLIIYQRGYQANSRVVVAMDEISQETINLKR